MFKKAILKKSLNSYTTVARTVRLISCQYSTPKLVNLHLFPAYFSTLCLWQETDRVYAFTIGVSWGFFGINAHWYVNFNTAWRMQFYVYLSNWPTWCTKFLFYNKFIPCLYMFRAHVLETCKTKILCIKLVNYWDKYTEMHDQQNVRILCRSLSGITYALIYVSATCKDKHWYYLEGNNPVSQNNVLKPE